MSTNFTNNAGRNSGGQAFSFNRNFLGSRNSIKVNYDSMPKEYRAFLDSFAISVLEPNGGKVMVTGSASVGKSFFIEQLYHNKQVFMDRANLPALEFVNVPLEHAVMIAQGGAGRWIDYVELVSNIFTAPLNRIIFVTESIDAAIGITNAGGKIVLEATPQTIHQLQIHENTGAVKQWSSWEIHEINSVLLKPAAMIEMLTLAHLDALNKEYPNIELTKKHVALLVNQCVKEGELLVEEEMSPEYKGLVIAQPGIMAKALFRFASTLAFDGAMRNSKDKLNYNKAAKETYRNFEGIFFKSLHDFLVLIDEDSDDDPGFEAIKAAIESQLPGMQVLGFPSAKFEEDATDSLDLEFSDFKTLESRISKEILGQDNAISTIVNGLKVSAAGLNSDTKPLRSMLLLGPTGVGKTQFSLTLAKELMTEELPVLRIDMSEYGSSHEASKLIGSPPGYAGHENGGVLTNFVLKNPNALVIIDELEKAHPKVWDNFLQILDAGRLTDSNGRVVDFTKTVIIMTSNLGAAQVKKASAGFSKLSSTEAYRERSKNSQKITMKALESELKPELINRFDDIVVFNELPTEIIRKVVAKEIDATATKLEARGFTLQKPNNAILDYIANKSDASKYGAREIQRVVGTNIIQLIAEEVLNNSDNKIITLSLKNDDLLVKSEAPKAEASKD